MRGQLLRDSAEASAVLQKEQTRNIELLSTPHNIYNITTASSGGSADGNMEGNVQVKHVHDSQHHAITASSTTTVDSSSDTTIYYENSTINVLHV